MNLVRRYKFLIYRIDDSNMADLGIVASNIYSNAYRRANIICELFDFDCIRDGGYETLFPN